jgi:hypothetical protein
MSDFADCTDRDDRHRRPARTAIPAGLVEAI